MTDRIEPTTDAASAKEPRHNGTPETTPSTTPGTTSARTPGETPGRTPGAASERTSGAASDRTSAGAAGITSGDSKSLKPKSGGPDDLSVPPAPRTAPAAQASERTGRHGTTGTGTEGPLVSRDHQDKLSQRMQQAVTDFVESPRRAVEEADSTFDEIVSGLTEALTERRRVLRASWQEQDTDAQTEELRIALQRYRDISEQLLKI
ncbi:hypothetical protein [Streptomyces sp. NBC_01185]|uniref:hypothetical protein n=1 Tax=Streptomyces sp. NBC_01185 TaxID=2903764 RepID=UPI003868E1E4|nr:hypothetical protein OG770_35315 [Streptomyces sp. NBC_01185]